MEREHGEGALFYRDGRELGPVRYRLRFNAPIVARAGTIEGHVFAFDPGAHAPFYAIVFPEGGPPDGRAALRLADGRWWLCVLQPDGQARNSGGLHPSGPQPTGER